MGRTWRDDDHELGGPASGGTQDSDDEGQETDDDE